MNLKRTAKIGAVGGALAAWLAAAATSGIRDVAPTRGVTITPIEMRGAELANEIARLHDRLRPTSSPRQPGRNLFQFTSPRPRPVAPIASKPALTEAVVLPAGPRVAARAKPAKMVARDARSPAMAGATAMTP